MEPVRLLNAAIFVSESGLGNWRQLHAAAAVVTRVLARQFGARLCMAPSASGMPTPGFQRPTTETPTPGAD